MGERDMAVGVRARPGDPARCTLRYRPDAPPPPAEPGRVVFRLVLEQDGRSRALVDVPIDTTVADGHPQDQLQAVIGTLAARQLSRLAARGHLPEGALLPLRLVGLDLQVARLLHQPQLPLDADGAWVVTA